MASTTHQSSSQAYIEHTLEQFILHGVVQTHRTLGSGTFGCVVELSVNGLICAGKMIFEVLVDRKNEGADRMIKKYYDECQLLSSLRHPNIVQFLGICFLQTQPTSTANQLPVLVMEMLQGSLDDMLENTPDIPLAKKCSILQDVARGLVYLHGRTPAVIHRDLTARNVLLDSAMVAKIADMGNSRIAEAKALATVTSVPGTLVYMPPEAMNSPKYHTPLDIFSFGHLALYTATQVFPGNLLPPNYKDPKTGKIVGHSEIERRGKYMKILEESQLTKSHALVKLVKECLEYDAGSRPSASEALQKLEHIASTIDDHCHRMSRLQLEKQIHQQEEQIKLLEPFAIHGLEKMEHDLLTELKRVKGVEGRLPTPNIAKPYIEFNGFRYNSTQGDIAGNAISLMIIVAVGDRFPEGLVVEQRDRNSILADKAIEMHGQLPMFVTGLHKEAAADLIATTSNDMKSLNVNLVRICIDSPALQRPKTYYLQIITDFFKTAEHPVVAIDYLGHSEKNTGNWCFKDDVISYAELVDLHQKHCPTKLFTIQSDCCYSGQWVLECAKILDKLGIPPCGHRARERNVLLKVFSSCQFDQKAVEPGYSMEAMLVGDDGIAMSQVVRLINQKSAWFSSAKLLCCKDPDSPCPKNTFAHLKWMDGVNRSFPIKTVQRKERDVDKWYFLMLQDSKEETARAFNAEIRKNPSLKLSRWGYVLLSGDGSEIPSYAYDTIGIWTTLSA